MLLREGRSLCIYNDSKILRSLELLQLSMILKLSKTIGEPHVSAWSRILLWGGLAKILSVR